MRFSDWTEGDDLGRAASIRTVVYLSSAGKECWCFPRVP